MKSVRQPFFFFFALFCMCFTEIYAGPYTALSELLLKEIKPKWLKHAVVQETSDFSFAPGANRIALKYIAQKDSIAKADYYVLKGVSFDSGSAEINEDSEMALTKVAEVMLSHPEIVYEILGYTDEYECKDSCMLLSAKRAALVRNFLVRCGVPELRLIIKGMGSSQLISMDSTLEKSSLNRRVEFLRIDRMSSYQQSEETSTTSEEMILLLLIPIALVALFVKKHTKKKKEDEYYRKIAEKLDDGNMEKKKVSSFDLAKEEAEYRKLKKNLQHTKEKKEDNVIK